MRRMSPSLGLWQPRLHPGLDQSQPLDSTGRMGLMFSIGARVRIRGTKAAVPDAPDNMWTDAFLGRLAELAGATGTVEVIHSAMALVAMDDFRMAEIMGREDYLSWPMADLELADPAPHDLSDSEAVERWLEAG